MNHLKNLKHKLNNGEKGLTIVVLIIVIIVMLILAGIVIRSVGDGGLTGRTKTAITDYEEFKDVEQNKAKELITGLDNKDNTKPDLTIKPSTKEWTREDIKAVTSIKHKPDGYEIYMRKGINGDWIKETETTVKASEYSEPVKISAALVKEGSEIKPEHEVYIMVENIDVKKPTKTAPDATPTKTTITVICKQTDDQSGIDKDKTQYAIRKKGDDDDSWTWQKDNKFKDLEEGTEYEVKTKVTDKVGNEQESDVTEVITLMEKDETKPTDTAPATIATTSTVTVINKQTDKESGIDETKTQYAIRKEGETEWSEWQNENEFKNLDQKTTYEVKTKSTDKQGNEQESQISKVTTKELVSGTLTLKLDNENGDNYVEGSKTNHNVYVSLNNGNATTTYSSLDGSAQKVTNETGAIIISQEGKTTLRVTTTDGKNTVTKDYVIVIDKKGPSNTAPDATSTTNKITVTNKQTDESGLDDSKTQYAIRKEGETEWSDWQNSNEFTDLDDNTTYEVKTKSTDTVGNESESEIKKIKTSELVVGTLTLKLDDANGENYTEGTKTNHNVYVSLNNGNATTTYSSVEGSAQTVSATNEAVTITQEGTTTLRVTTTDGKNTVTKDYVIVIDSTVPSATITSDVTTEPTKADSVKYTIQFTEDVKDFTADDINVTNGTKGTFKKENDRTYTIVVTGAETGVQTVSINSGACTDIAGNLCEPASKSITFDKTAPIIGAMNATPDATTIDAVIEGASDASGIKEYDFYINGQKVATTTDPNYKYTGLTPSTEYTLKYVVRDTLGNEAESDEIKVWTLANPPSLTATGSNNAQGKQITLTINANSNPEGTTYEIFSVTDNKNVYTGTDLSYVHSNLGTNVTKKYKARAKTPAGEYTGWSTEVSGNTLASPTVTKSITGDEKNSGKNTISISWNKVAGAKGYGLYIFDGKTYRKHDLGDVTSWNSDTAKIYPTSAQINNWNTTSDPFRWNGDGEAWRASSNDLYTKSGGIASGTTPSSDYSYYEWIHVYSYDSSSRVSGTANSGAAKLSGTTIDTDAPNSFVPTATQNSSNSVTITGSTTDQYMTNKHPGSGIRGYKFAIYKDGAWEWTEEQTGTSYTFAGLRQSTNYPVKMIAYDNNDNYIETAEVTGKTIAVPSMNGKIDWTYSTTKWTKGSVTATASTSITGYTLQTSQTSATAGFTDVASQTRTTNGTVWARLWDGTNAGAVSTGTINNIDTTAPTATSVEITNVSSSGYDVYVHGVNDTQSGVDRVQFPTWTNENGQDDLVKPWRTAAVYKGEDLGNGTWHYRVNISDFNYSSGVYTTHVYTFDKVGNERYVGGNNNTEIPSVKINYNLGTANNMNTWDSNFKDRFNIEYDQESGLSKVSCSGKGGWENLYVKLNTETGKKYKVSFDFKNPDGYSPLSGYNGIGYQAVTSVSNANNLANSLETQYLSKTANSEIQRLSLEFTATGETTYFNFNFGMAADNKTSTVYLGNVSLEEERQANSEIGSSLSVFEVPGHTLNGYFTNKNGTGTQISEADKVPTTDTTYYGKWTINQYYLDMNYKVDGTNYNNGYVSSSNKRLYAGLKVNGEDKGYIFDHYAQYDYNSVYEIYGYKFDGVEVQLSTPITGYIKGTTSLRPEFYTLTASVNDSTLGTVSATNSLIAPKDATYSTNGATLTLSDGRKITASTKSVTGYTVTFGSWSTPSATFNKALTVTANFTKTANTYNVIYNKNAPSGKTVSGTMENSVLTYDTEAKLRKNTYTLVGYTFKGWATKATGDVIYTDEQSVNNLTNAQNGNFNLYAIWKDETGPSVTFGTNGNSSAAKNASTKVTVTDEGTGVKADTLKSLWTTRSSGITKADFTGNKSGTFTNEGTLSIPSNCSGEYYLYIYAEDNEGNSSLIKSNKFTVSNMEPNADVTLNTTEPTNGSVTFTIKPYTPTVLYDNGYVKTTNRDWSAGYFPTNTYGGKKFNITGQVHKIETAADTTTRLGLSYTKTDGNGAWVGPAAKSTSAISNWTNIGGVYTMPNDYKQNLKPWIQINISSGTAGYAVEYRNIQYEFFDASKITSVKVNGTAVSLTDGVGTYTATANGTYNIVLTDIYGNTKTITKTVSNIDKTAPEAGTLNTTPATTSISGTVVDASDASGIKEYEFYINGTKKATQESPTYNYTGLTPGTTYTLTYVVRDNAGNTVTSSEYKVATLANVPTLTATGGKTAQGQQITLSVGANSNPTGTTYEIYSVTDSKAIYTGTNLSYANTGIATNTTKKYKVRAQNPDGVWSAYSAEVSGNTLASPGGATITVTGNAVNSGTNSISISWNAVQGAAGYGLHIFDGKSYRSHNLGNVTSWNSDDAKYFPTAAQIVSWDGNSDPFRWSGDGQAWMSSLNDMYVKTNTKYKNYSYYTWIQIYAYDSASRVSGAANNGATQVNRTTVDRNAPNTFTPTASKNKTNSITVSGSTTDRYMTTSYPGSGIRGYKFGIYKDSKWTWSAEQTETSYTFTGLAQNTSYNVKMQAYDNQGNYVESEQVSGKTVSVPDTISFAQDPTTWTNGNKTITASTTETGYTLQTKLNNGSWESKATQTTTQYGDIVYARLYDGTNYGGTKTYNEAKIDTAKPNNTKPTATSTTKSIKVTNKQADVGSGSNTSTSASGIKTIQYAIKKTADTAWGSWQTSATFNNLVHNTSYDVKTQVTDNATNVQESAVTTIKTKQVPDTITLTPSTTEWTNGNITVTASTTETGYTLQTKLNNGSWGTSTTQTTTQNGDVVYARLYDGKNYGATKTYTEAKIDKVNPEITANNIAYGQNLSITLKDSLSGVKGWQVTDSNTKPTSGWKEITAIAETTVTKSGLTAGTWYVWAKDVVGNTVSKEITVGKATPTVTVTPSSAKAEVNYNATGTFKVKPSVAGKWTTISSNDTNSVTIQSPAANSAATANTDTTITYKGVKAKTTATTITITFTPTDTSNYEAVTKTFEISKVNKIDPTVTLNKTSAAVNYNATGTFTATPNVAGKWTTLSSNDTNSVTIQSPAANSAATANTATTITYKGVKAKTTATTITVTFTPTDTTNYNTKTVTFSVTKVNKIDPTVTLNKTSATVNYNATGTFTATPNVAGKWTTLSSDDTSHVSVESPAENSAATANTATTIKFKGVKAKTTATTITVTLTPTDTTNYNTKTVTFSVTKVNKIDPTLTITPTSASGEVTYNATNTFKVKPNVAGKWTTISSDDTSHVSVESPAANSAATANTDTTFTYKGVDVKTTATTITVTFTPTDTTNYNTKTATYSVTKVNKATPTITLNKTSAAVNYNATGTFTATPSVAGKWSTLSSDDTNSVTIQSPAANSAATASTASTITFKGVKAKTTATTITLTLTPTDTTHYNTATKTFSVTKVNPIDPTLTITPTSASGEVTYNSTNTFKIKPNVAGKWTTISSDDTSHVSVESPAANSAGTANTDTTFTYKGVDVKTTATTISVTFTPTSGNYKAKTVTYSVTKVNKATPTITLDKESAAVNYNATGTFNAKPSVAGKWSTLSSNDANSVTIQSPAVNSAATANTNTLITYKGVKAKTTATTITVTLTPTDTTHYNTATKTFSVTKVNKIDPTVTLNKTSAAVNYNATGTFTATPNVAGKWTTISSNDTNSVTIQSPSANSTATANSATTITFKGVKAKTTATTITLTLTPTDTTNYNTKTVTFSVTKVNKIDPTLTITPTSASGEVTYNATNTFKVKPNVAGKWTTISSNDTSHVSIESPAANSAATANTDTTFTYKGVDVKTTATTITVTFTPTDTTNYNTKTVTYSVTKVNKATPTITLDKASAAVNYNATGTFNAKPSVAGKWTTISSNDTNSVTIQSPAANSGATANTNTLITYKGVKAKTTATTITLTLTPTDTTHYNTATKTFSVTKVNKIDPTLTITPTSASGEVTYNATNTFKVKPNVAGKWTTISSNDTSHVSVTSPAANSAGTANTDTTFTYKGVEPKTTATTITVTFTPTDTTNYNTKTVTYSVTKVNKITPTITLDKASAAVNYNATGTFNAKPSVAGKWTTISSNDTNSVTIQSPAANSGATANTNTLITYKGVKAKTTATTITLTLTPTDTTHYNTATKTFSVTKVNKIDPTLTITPSSASGEVTYNATNTFKVKPNVAGKWTTISSNDTNHVSVTSPAANSAGTANTDTTFTYKGVEPKTTATTITVTFTPTDTTNYNTKTVTYSVTKVNKITPTITLDKASAAVNYNATGTFTATPSVAGKWSTLSSNDTSHVSVESPAANSAATASTATTITYKGVKAKTTATTITVTLTPTDTTHYTTATKTFSVTKVNKIDPTLTITPTAASGEVTYNSTNTFKVKPNVAGKWTTISSNDTSHVSVESPAANSAATANTDTTFTYKGVEVKTTATTITVTFTPTDTTNYNTKTVTYSVTKVNKITPTVTLNKTSAAVNYNATGTFTATPSVAGKWSTISSNDTSCVTVQSPAANSAATASTATTITYKGVKAKTTATTITLTLTPTDTTHYNTATKTFSVTKVNKINPTLTATAKTIIAGNSDTQTITYTGDGTLSAESSDTTKATVSLSGKSLTVNTVAGATAGEVTVTISATAGTNYNAKTATCKITVQKAIYEVSSGSPKYHMQLQNAVNTVATNGTIKVLDNTTETTETTITKNVTIDTNGKTITWNETQSSGGGCITVSDGTTTISGSGGLTCTNNAYSTIVINKGTIATSGSPLIKSQGNTICSESTGTKNISLNGGYIWNDGTTGRAGETVAAIAITQKVTVTVNNTMVYAPKAYSINNAVNGASSTVTIKGNSVVGNGTTNTHSVVLLGLKTTLSVEESAKLLDGAGGGRCIVIGNGAANSTVSFSGSSSCFSSSEGSADMIPIFATGCTLNINTSGYMYTCSNYVSNGLQNYTLNWNKGHFASKSSTRCMFYMPSGGYAQAGTSKSSYNFPFMNSYSTTNSSSKSGLYKYNKNV